jgi:glycosyltransferase involved in cell wall biosynthesis
MRVLYDHQIFHYQRIGGISRYFYELFKRFPPHNSVEAVIPFRFTNNEYLLQSKAHYGFIQPTFLGNTSFPGKGWLWSIRDKYFPQYNATLQNKLNVLKRLKEGEYDVFHPTYFEDYYSGIIGTVPVVITIYDLIYEKYPDHFPEHEVNEVLRNKKSLIQRADQIITISQSAKNDLCKLYTVDENKIRVVYLGNSLQESDTAIDSIQGMELPKKYILYVGNRDGYKNFSPFVRSIAPLFHNDRNLHLMCTGRKFTSVEIALFKELRIESRVHVRFVSDQMLIQLYKNARAFVFPSLYEGFGIPVIEAMSNGCPAVISNTSSLPEIGGSAALYFDPHISDSMRQAVERCLNDDSVRSEMISKGRKHAASFSWDITAQQTAEIYNSLLSQRK